MVGWAGCDRGVLAGTVRGMVPFSRRVFEYLDYREYLTDFYTHQKANSYGFSYRTFAKAVGCKSVNHPHLVITGRRNLTSAMGVRFAQACGLTEEEQAYFSDLVAFTQAKTPTEKQHFYTRLGRYAPFRKVHKLSEAQATYFSKWFIPATRELAARADFRAEPHWIANMLQPSITVSQAKQALKTLGELGLIAVDAAGSVTRSEPLVSSGGPLGHHLVAFHREMLERASEAIELIPREEREISSVTVCVSQKRLIELKQQLREFRQQLLRTAEQDDEPERVVQINVQLFPLSKGKS
jgi:uncharacterized protein (TIGR02147 family)